MKTIKVIAATALIAAGALMFQSCNSTKKTTHAQTVNTTKMTIPSTDLPHHSGLAMTVSPTSYDGVPENVKVRLANNTESVAQFGAEFVIEHFDDGKWSVVPGTENFPVIMIMYTLPADASQEYTFYLRGNVVKYEKGQYRLSKRVMLDNTTNYGVSAEFTIE